MWHTHVITYLDTDKRQSILDALDELDYVVNWRAAVGGIFAVTMVTINADKLGLDLVGKLSNTKFVVSTIIGRSQGSADNETWEFLNDPKSV